MFFLLSSYQSVAWGFKFLCIMRKRTRDSKRNQMMQEAHSFAISNGIEISYESVCLADDKHKTREENV
ncbi:unnamed protein product [Prunus brigantina]